MNIKFDTQTGLVPAIIQDVTTKNVLMLGYMNQAAYEETINSGKVCFYSRSKERLWTKGETSGHFLELVDIKNDCDADTLLIKVIPHGPTCHKGTDNCWGEDNDQTFGFLTKLEDIITQRKSDPSDKSYTSSLFKKGINKIAQKVGEEAVETVIEALNQNDDLFVNESADLLYHYLILLQAKGFTLKDVSNLLEKRHEMALAKKKASS